MARSRETMWLSAIADMYPSRPRLNGAIVRTVNLPVVGPLLRSKVHPHECYRFWDYYSSTFSQPLRDLSRRDLGTEERAAIRAALVEMTAGRGARVLLKVTGWPRVGYLDALLPECQIIHIVRDPRAVVSSLLRVSWWDGRLGPEAWRYGPLSRADQQDWEMHGSSLAALAAIQWRMHTTTAAASLARRAPSRSMLVRYESLARDPASVLRDLSTWLRLDLDTATNDVSGGIGIRDDGWRNHLTADDVDTVAAIAGPNAKQFGYYI